MFTIASFLEGDLVLESNFWLSLWVLRLGSGVSCEVAGCKLFSASQSCIFSLCFVLLFFSVVSNYWKSALILTRILLPEKCHETRSARWEGGTGLDGGERRRKVFWRFSIYERAQCAAPAAANTLDLKYELKRGLKPGGGKCSLFSETVFDHKVVGCAVLIAKAAVPIREKTGAIKSRVVSLPGTSQEPQWDWSHGYMKK